MKPNSKKKMFSGYLIFNVQDRVLWMFLVIGGFSIATNQALQAWRRYEKSPIVITMEKDFFNWEIEFPSVIICLRQKSATANKNLATFIQKYNISATLEELSHYVDDLLFNTYLTYSDLKKYENGSAIDYLSPDLYLELVNLTSPRLVTQKQQKGRSGGTSVFWPKNIEGRYVMIVTEFGLCHSFHSELSAYFDIENFSKNGILESTYQSIPLSYNEPAVKLDQKKILYSYLLFLVSPIDMIDINSRKYFSNVSSMTDISLDVVQIVSDDSIKNLSPAQRHCKFPHESDGLFNSPIYSHNLCHIECRIKFCLEFCNCTPYYYKRSGGEPVCNMTGMYCLSKYQEIVTLTDSSNKDLCPCLQNCDHQEIIIPEIQSHQWFLDSSLSVKLETFPRERYRRSLIYSKTDLLIQVGGLFGLFLGCSVLSLIEIPYFLTLRFFWAVFGKRPIKPQI